MKRLTVLLVAFCALMSLSVASMAVPAGWVMFEGPVTINSITGTGTFVAGVNSLSGTGNDENDSYATATYAVVYSWVGPGLPLGFNGGIRGIVSGQSSSAGQTAGSQVFQNGNIVWQDYADYDDGPTSYDSAENYGYYVMWPYKYVLVTLKVYVKGTGTTAYAAALTY
ncbi:MAG: hypothetical protein WC773_01940 [Patescibacteria group bacterium]|jgi:hypothetical protein